MSRCYLFGWGSASEGQLGEAKSDILIPRPIRDVPTLTTVIDFMPGLWSSLILTPNDVFTTRFPDNNPGSFITLPPSPSSSFVSAAKGRDFTLLLTACGSLYSVGIGAFGELGLGDQSFSLIPTKIHSLEKVRITAVCAAEFHWLALDAFGAVFACGNNAYGQLGLGHSDSVCSPTRVVTLWPHPIVCISTGDGHSAALSADGLLFCFGSNKYGQLGNSSFRVRVASLTPSLVSLPSMQVMDSVKLGDVNYMKTDHSFNDQVFSFNGAGNITDPQYSQFFVDVACGSAHTIALRNDGILMCWGKGESGQLGTCSTRALYEPAEVRVHANFVTVSAGERHSAAVTEDGRAFMWGDGSSGQLGHGDVNNKYAPFELPSPRVPGERSTLRFLRLRCGGFHTLAYVGDESASVYSAVNAHKKRIPQCLIDNMLQPKAGLARFGSAGVLLRSFLRQDRKYLSPYKIDYIGAETAHVKFLHMFGDDGKWILRLAAARIRHQAQVAFGLVQDDEVIGFSEDEHYTETNLVTPKSMFSKNGSHFRSSVANSVECGYLFFLALMNPIYGIAECTSELAELAALLLRCEEGARHAFLEAISHCEEGVLMNRIIQPLQCVLTDELRGYRRITRNAIFATKMLALCYHGVRPLSRKNKARGFSLSRKMFHNEAVSGMVNFVEDYERWSQGREQYMLANGSQKNSAVDVAVDKYSMESMNLPPLPSAEGSEGPFAFCSYSFLLTEEAKFRILQIESTMTMNKESMRSLLSFGAAQVPFGRLAELRMPAEQMAHLQYLVLYVRRGNIVSDTYGQVVDYAYNQPRALRKPLKVIFKGEEGVDEGGVSKEFYQVLMERILSPDYGMFEHDDGSHFHWFRKQFLESEGSWQMIGLMFGLAAFNSILLNVQFPPVIYRKLAIAVKNAHLQKHEAFPDSDSKHELRYHADLIDIKETFPVIGASLERLKDYDGEDVEDVFGLTFEISYLGLFGKVENVELIENGSQITVTRENRDKFIALYVEFLINKSIEKAFNPFAAGFVFMLNGPFVNVLTADDLETLVIGEKELDFSGLRQATWYEGYFEKSPVVKFLWQVLDEYDEEMKRLFLAFVTGTDRAPIGGLQKLKLIVQREGPNSNRLPTSRTCFNVLLLPEYSSRAKLRDRLSTAIRNSKGFGLQ